MGDSARFGRLWDAWDARIQAGEPPTEILRSAKDEDLVEILAGESSADRKYARDIIATELLNRLRARSMSQSKGARGVSDSAERAHELASSGQDAIHHAEEILKNSGQWDLGAAVSASAYASLAATRASFDAARAHSDHLRGSLGQSRVGSELAEELAVEAARAAAEGREITRLLEARMESMGRGKEGRAASEASRAIQNAADRAADGASAQESDARSDRDRSSEAARGE